MKKVLLFILILFFAVGGSVFFYNKYFSLKPQNNATQLSYNVFQSIGNVTTAHKTTNKQTALILLQKTNNTIIKGEGTNAFVQSINGVMANPAKNQFWAFYINGKAATVGAGSYYLQPNDKIEWKIESY